ncbi:hypothetical protein HY640_02070 [Candidatus Woesearchaeota archaeon]|nr:hypothetical protein [Candidatus Woesearchaeota archaeon]
MGMMFRAKQGVFFTITMIVVMAIFVLATAPKGHVTQRDSISSVNIRVGVANAYSESLKNAYLKSVVETSARDAVIAMVRYINVSEQYFSDEKAVQSVFREVLLNGSVTSPLVGAQPVDCYIHLNGDLAGAHRVMTVPTGAQCMADMAGSTDRIMRGRSLFEKLAAIENASMGLLGINTSFNRTLAHYNVSLFQSNESGPWSMGINMTFTYTVNSSVVFWRVSHNLSAFFPLEGILDPVYLKESGHHFNKTIDQTRVLDWDTGNDDRRRNRFIAFVNNESYRYNDSAPSFLMRLYGNLSNGGTSIAGSSCCGIESVVNPNRVSVSRCIQKSYVDWCLYGSSCIPVGGPVPNAPPVLWNLSRAPPPQNRISRYDPPVTTNTFYGLKLNTPQSASYGLVSFRRQDMGKDNGVPQCL